VNIVHDRVKPVCDALHHKQSCRSNDPNDFVVIEDGPEIGRIYQYLHGPQTGKWAWFLKTPKYANGVGESLEAAKKELEERYFFEHRKLAR
jgi:hypothetical protein